jgi:hypothetical protein
MPDSEACAIRNPKFAGERIALPAQKAAHRARSEDQAALAVENEHGVFEILQEAIDISAQVGHFVLRAAQPFPQQAHFGRHDGDFVAGGLAGGLLRFIFAAGKQIELAAQPGQRTKCERGKEEREADGADHGDDGVAGAQFQVWSD